MYVSAATLLGVDVGAPTEHTYTEIVDEIRQHGADAQADIEELWRRIAFSILITNVDDHLHNHGFLTKNLGVGIQSVRSLRVAIPTEILWILS